MARMRDIDEEKIGSQTIQVQLDEEFSFLRLNYTLRFTSPIPARWSAVVRFLNSFASSRIHLCCIDSI